MAVERADYLPDELLCMDRGMRWMDGKKTKVIRMFWRVVTRHIKEKNIPWDDFGDQVTVSLLDIFIIFL